MEYLITYYQEIIMLLMAFAVLSLTRKQHKLRIALTDRYGQVSALQNSVNALCSGAVGLGERLLKTEQKLKLASERQARMELQSGNEGAYNQAIRMVRSGAGLNDLVKSCGLTAGEAKLVAMMNRADQSFQ